MKRATTLPNIEMNSQLRGKGIASEVRTFEMEPWTKSTNEFCNVVFCSRFSKENILCQNLRFHL